MNPCAFIGNKSLIQISREKIERFACDVNKAVTISSKKTYMEICFRQFSHILALRLLSASIHAFYAFR